MNARIERNGLSIAAELFQLVNEEIAPGAGVDSDHFWAEFGAIVDDLAPKNRELLEIRGNLQRQISDWHLRHPGPIDPAAYTRFLREIGYLLPEGDEFEIATSGVDPEIAAIAGPQLVVPVSNARYALNAANARWGSLYDAYYGTDVIPEDEGFEKGTRFNPNRGERVIAMAAGLLDEVVPLAEGRHARVKRYSVDQSVRPAALRVDLEDGRTTWLLHPEQFAGFTRSGEEERILLSSNGLHIELQVDRGHPVGQMSLSGLKDIVLESAMTTIQDCEDSVAAVDAEDKVNVYRNWLGLMRGDLEDTFEKGGKTLTRCLEPDRVYTAPEGGDRTLPGRSLMLVRNVGHLMTTSAVLDSEGREIPEGFLDGMVTVLCAMHDLRGGTTRPNSRSGSIYIVKPKMHGPEEVAFTNTLFNRIEDALGLERHTVKVGIMDEERRTTVNLKECIRQVRQRVVFINTGFLDRTGDEIHTSMEAGAMLPKEAIKVQPWILAYEDWNVDIGLECGFRGKAQIGKGMCARDQDGPTRGRRELRLGAVADRGHPARHPLPQVQRQPAAGRTGCAWTRASGRYPDAAAAGRSRPRRRGNPGRTRQQRPGHPRLRRALGGPGRRLLQGARYPQRRPDGGPGDIANFQPAHLQLAAPWSLFRRAGHGDHETHGPNRRRAERGRPPVSQHGAGLRGQHRLPGRLRPRFSRARATERVHRAAAPPSPRRGESPAGLMTETGFIRRRGLAALFAAGALLPMAAAAESPLFSDDKVIELALTVDFHDLCRPRESEDCDFAPTSLEYKDASGDWRSLPIEIQIRGGWRSLARNCSAPLLWVRFEAGQVAGTPFEGQSLLPLTTHCGQGLSLDRSNKRATRADHEQYLLREYLGHLLYRRLTEFSVGVRLVRIAYPDPDRSGRSARHYAFFTEHFDDVAARTGSRLLPRGSFEAEKLDAQSAATLALFQFMIGNTDWSIARERNTALLIKDGRQIPVPYDLDMSGLVDASYAGPAVGLPINSVRQRYFLGYCQPGTDWERVFANFDEQKSAMLALPPEIPGFSRKSRRTTVGYLEKFFEIIAQPDVREGCIMQGCQPWPPAPEDHTSRRGAR
jgi:malate synthase